MKRKKLLREVRRVRRQAAGIALRGKPTAECEIMDISKNGAKIVSDGTCVIPDQFELALVHGGRKPCEVIWRRGRIIGVKFVG